MFKLEPEAISSANFAIFFRRFFCFNEKITKINIQQNKTTKKSNNIYNG